MAVVKARPKPATEAERFAQCRALGHTWKHRRDPVGPKEETPPFYGAVGFMSICADCGAERIKWMGRSGSLVPSRYRYPDGYQSRGDEVISREGWRRTWVVSIFGEEVKK